MTLKSTWKPTASICDFTNSFIGSGCICPDPEVEIASVILHGMQPASFSSALAFSGLYSYLIGIAVIRRARRHRRVFLDREAAEQFDEFARG